MNLTPNWVQFVAYVFVTRDLLERNLLREDKKSLLGSGMISWNYAINVSYGLSLRRKHTATLPIFILCTVFCNDVLKQ